MFSLRTFWVHVVNVPNAGFIVLRASGLPFVPQFPYSAMESTCHTLVLPIVLRENQNDQSDIVFQDFFFNFRLNLMLDKLVVSLLFLPSVLVKMVKVLHELHSSSMSGGLTHVAFCSWLAFVECSADKASRALITSCGMWSPTGS